MKSFILKLCICVFLFKNILSKSSLSTCKFYLNLAGDVLGESSTDGAASKGAITYALGSDGGYTLKDSKVKVFFI
jgi:hypothetical protein